MKNSTESLIRMPSIYYAFRELAEDTEHRKADSLRTDRAPGEMEFVAAVRIVAGQEKRARATPGCGW